MAHLTNLSFEFFMKFSQKMPLYFFYTIVQKAKMTKTQIKGSCLPGFLVSLIDLKVIACDCVKRAHVILHVL